MRVTSSFSKILSVYMMVGESTPVESPRGVQELETSLWQVPWPGPRPPAPRPCLPGEETASSEASAAVPKAHGALTGPELAPGKLLALGGQEGLLRACKSQI